MTKPDVSQEFIYSLTKLKQPLGLFVKESKIQKTQIEKAALCKELLDNFNVFLLDFVDEELYALRQDYIKNKEQWLSDFKPVIDDSNQVLTLDFLEKATKFIVVIIESGNVFIQEYNNKKNEISHAMQDKFAEWISTINSELKDYWTPTQNTLSPLLKDQKAISEIEKRIALHRSLVPIWDSRVNPNIEALLVEQKDVDIVQQIHDNLQELLTIWNNASTLIQTTYIQWKELAVKTIWVTRLGTVKKALVKSENKANSTLTNGNPELETPNSTNFYQNAPANAVLYKKGKGDKVDLNANDVQQGKLDDCFVLGSIAALAKNCPDDLKKLIIPQNGGYEVTLYLRTNPDSMDRTATTLFIKNEFVVDKNGNPAFAGNGDGELWVQILEKAYAQAMGGYDALYDGGNPKEILQVFTNKKVVRGSIEKGKKEELLLIFQDAILNKKTLTLSSCLQPLKGGSEKTFDDGQILVYNHTYYLGKVNNSTIILQNPQAKNHLKLDWDRFLAFFVEYSQLG